MTDTAEARAPGGGARPADPRRPSAGDRSRLLWWAVSGAAAAAAVTYVGLVDPHVAGRYPVCPLHALTGLWCPFCGGLRATHDLLTGQLAAAVGENALVVVGFPLLALLWLLRRSPPSSSRTIRVLVVVAAIVFGVARNLPFGAALAP